MSIKTVASPSCVGNSLDVMQHGALVRENRSNGATHGNCCHRRLWQETLP